MKRPMLALSLALLAALPVSSRAGTLFPGYIQTTGYLTANARISQLGDGETGTFLGGGAGVLLNRKLAIGGDLAFLADDLAYRTPDGEDRFLEYTTLNLRIGYIFLAESIVHPVVSLDGGLGWLQVRNPNRGVDERNPDADTVFQVQPVVHLVLNLTRNSNFSVGGGYRWVSGIDTGDIRDEDGDGAFAEIMVSFGAF